MANTIVRLPLGYFPDPDIGRPMWNAKIYVGVVGLDPREVANQKTVTGRQENGNEIPLAQPIRTSKGGIPVDNSGNDVTLLVDGAYSMAVDDRNDNQKYYFANVLDGEPLTNDSLVDATVIATGTNTPRTLGDRFTDTVNVKDFGAVGDGITDDTAAINACIEYCLDNNAVMYSVGGVSKADGLIQIFNNDSVARPRINLPKLNLGTTGSVVIGSTACRIIDGFISIPKLEGVVGATTDGLLIKNAQFNQIEIGLIERFKNGVLIQPQGFNCGDNTISIGRVSECENGIHMDNSLSVGIDLQWHAQNTKILLGFASFNAVGMRKTVIPLGAPMDLSYLTGAFDFNTQSDIIDDQQDSRSTYNLTFNDAGNVFTVESLAGVGISSSLLNKQVRGSGVSGMFTGIGDELAGFIDYGKLRTAGLSTAEEPILEVNNNNRTLGNEADLLFTHSNSTRGSLSKAAKIAAPFSSDTKSELVVSILSGGNLVESVRLDDLGIFPNVDNTKSLGKASNLFNKIFADRYHLNGGNFIVSGEGAPNGVITAPVGSMYTNRVGGAGTTLYVKESGTGNTGWVAK